MSRISLERYGVHSDALLDGDEIQLRQDDDEEDEEEEDDKRDRDDSEDWDGEDEEDTGYSV